LIHTKIRNFTQPPILPNDSQANGGKKSQHGLVFEQSLCNLHPRKMTIFPLQPSLFPAFIMAKKSAQASVQASGEASAKTKTVTPKTVEDITANGQSLFFTDSENPDSYSLKNQFAEQLEFRLVKDRLSVTQQDAFKALALSVRDRMIRNWIRTQRQY
jgi:hypothetical protein